METDDAKPIAASHDHDMEDVSQESQQCAKPSAACARRSWDGVNLRHPPGHLSDLRKTADTQMGGMPRCMEGNDRGDGAAGTEEDELADAFTSLNMEVPELSNLGGQFDAEVVTNYTDFEIDPF